MSTYPTPSPTPSDSSPPCPDDITPATFLPLFPVWCQIFRDLQHANPFLVSCVNKSLHAVINPFIYKRIVLDRSLPLPGVFRIHWESTRKPGCYRTLELVESLSVLDLPSLYHLLQALHTYRHSPEYSERKIPLFPKLRHFHLGREVLLACANEEHAADRRLTTVEGRECMTLGQKLGMALEGMMSPRELCLDTTRYRETDVVGYDTYERVINHIVSGIPPREGDVHLHLDRVKLPWHFAFIVKGAKEMRREVAETGWEDTRGVIHAVASLNSMTVEDFIEHQEDERWPEEVKRFYVVPYRDDLERVWKSCEKLRTVSERVWRQDERADSELWPLVIMREKDVVCECRRKK